MWTVQAIRLTLMDTASLPSARITSELPETARVYSIDFGQDRMADHCATQHSNVLGEEGLDREVS